MSAFLFRVYIESTRTAIETASCQPPSAISASIFQPSTPLLVSQFLSRPDPSADTQLSLVKKPCCMSPVPGTTDTSSADTCILIYFISTTLLGGIVHLTFSSLIGWSYFSRGPSIFRHTGTKSQFSIRFSRADRRLNFCNDAVSCAIYRMQCAAIFCAIIIIIIIIDIFKVA